MKPYLLLRNFSVSLEAQTWPGQYTQFSNWFNHFSIRLRKQKYGQNKRCGLSRLVAKAISFSPSILPKLTISNVANRLAAQLGLTFTQVGDFQSEQATMLIMLVGRSRKKLN